MTRFYRWFDGVQEPWRFMLAMALIMSPQTVVLFGTGAVRYLGAVAAVVLLVTRMAYVHRRK